MEKQMVESGSETAVMNAYLIAMLHLLKTSVDGLDTTAKKLKDQGKIPESGICSAFAWYMYGVYTITRDVKAYIAYQDKVSLIKIDNINHVYNQINRCSNMQKASDLKITIDYEQILHKLKALEDLVKAEQPDPTAIGDIAIELIRATLQAYNQLLDELKAQGLHC